MLTRGSMVLYASLLALAIAIVSLLPAGDRTALHTAGSAHTWVHLLAFAGLSCLIVLGVRSPGLRIALLIGVILLAWGSEFAEHVVNKSEFEATDVFADTIGIFSGCFLILFRSRK